MRPSLPAELADLLARLQATGGAPLAIGGDEVDAWPTGMAEALLTQGAIERAAPAASMACPGCEEACTMPVHQVPRDGAETAAFIVCDKRDDMGRVPVPLRLLARWQLTPYTLARALARGLGQDEAAPLAQGWRLGWSDGVPGRAAVLLQGQSIAVAGHRLDLEAVLTWDGRRLGLDERALKRHADTPAGGVAEETSEQRAQRLRARKAELVAGGRMDFLKAIAAEEGISDSRVKQIIGPKTKPALKAGPFDGLTPKPAKTTPVSTAGKRKD